ncbi:MULTISPECIES: arginyltransferase [Methylomonas]|uniref:Aspartate/glutamate leucyltransferase n=2 Tax=Methylomonas TaxID=416 RepID=A0A126T1X3_9GAMM|nr:MULTISPECIES: arginyltransferase [Methylomonas]AMK76079.1 arginyl-tRNA--protein transferase [Methylomonas denitrificans]OAH99794.1 arginyltransferase [Methylomonas methanica]TCV83900.1 arginine-tRNA-protein transferase [Methylomonas methanica]
MSSIPIWLDSGHACGYLDDRIARSGFVHPSLEMDTPLYSQLIAQGFRRSGDHVYKPYCESCQACVPTRLPVSAFRPDRKQKRCAKRNTQTRVVVKDAEFDPRHFRLYQRYLNARHDKPGEEPTSPDDYIKFLGSSWCDTLFVEFLIGGQLAAVAVVDVVSDGLSAVYTFFDPDFADYSPGVYAVLWQIETAKQLGLEYLYLGYWIKDCRKMRYKIDYQPLTGLLDGQWQAISNHTFTED